MIDSPLRSVRKIEVIEVQFVYGKGIAPDDPVRPVKAYFSLDGELLAQMDRWKEEHPNGEV